MLKYLKINNFYSYQDDVEINLESSLYWKLKSNVFQIWKNTLMKNMLIYWANASGKTNILKAITIIHNFTLNIGPRIITTPFLLDENSKNQPTLLEVWFFVDEKEYCYNFELFNGIVLSESLKEIKTNTELNLFIRNKNNIKFENDLVSFQGQIEDKVKETTSLLWILDQFNWKLNKKPILSFFKKIGVLWTGVFTPDETVKLLNLNESEKNKVLAIEFLKCADIDICDIRLIKENRNIVQFDFVKKSLVEWVEEWYRVEIWHKKENWEIEYFSLLWWQESTWTVKLFWMLWRILTAILNEWVLFIDEIENSLHPNIMKKIFELINSNLWKKYQFIFTTHSVEFMDLKMFKKEQIWIVEKKHKTKSSNFYTLYDFMDLRSEKNIQKMYKLWILWWVPNPTDFSILFNDIDIDLWVKEDQI